MYPATGRTLRTCFALATCSLVAVGIFHVAKSTAQSQTSMAASSDASPIFGVKIPPGYRDYKLIAVKTLEIGDKSHQLRAQLGNDIAIKAFREGTIPFPDGSIIAALHWTRVLADSDSKVIAGEFPGAESFIVGSPLNVQFMVKDSKKYAATGGWGFADFTNGKPATKKLHEACFPCHGPAKDHDYVFTRYAPTP
jgi:hypothetical protein